MSSQPYISRHFGSKEVDPKAGSNLSIYIDNESFMFAYLDAGFKQVLSLYHIRYNESMQHAQGLADRLMLLINNHGLGSRHWEHVNIALLNQNYTLLPSAFEMKENSRDLLHFSTGATVVTSLSHKFNNLILNYVPDTEVHQLLERNFHNASIRHAGAVNIDLLFNNRSLKSCDLLLNMNEGIFELVARNSNGLLYYNVFEYETREDVLYYILFMLGQFEMDPEKIKVGIAGQIEAGGELHNFIKKYLPYTSLAVNGVQPPAANGFPEHYYFTLLNQHLCEL